MLAALSKPAVAGRLMGTGVATALRARIVGCVRRPRASHGSPLLQLIEDVLLHALTGLFISSSLKGELPHVDSLVAEAI